MSILKKLNMFFKYGYKRDNSSLIKHLKNKGIKIGENVVFFSPEQSNIDTQYPFLITIGNDVYISAGIRILTHDYSWSVLKREYGEIFGSSGNVTIGNNVFMGADVTLLRNTKIGDNVIIGAGSLVTSEIPSNSVAVGRPAKVVMSIEEFYQKRKGLQLSEAENLFKSYYDRYHTIPKKEVFREYFFLFEGKYEDLSDSLKDVLKRGGLAYEKKSIDALNENKPLFNGYEEFVSHCKKKLGDLNHG